MFIISFNLSQGCIATGGVFAGLATLYVATLTKPTKAGMVGAMKPKISAEMRAWLAACGRKGGSTVTAKKLAHLEKARAKLAESRAKAKNRASQPAKY